MDIYTTSFCLPRSAAHSADLTTSTVTSPSTSFDYGPRDGTNGGEETNQGQRNVSGGGHQSTQSDGAVPPVDSTGNGEQGNGPRHSASNSLTDGQNGNGNGSTDSNGANGSLANKRGSVDLNDVMQRLCVDTMAVHQCIVSFSPVDPPSPNPNLSSAGDGGSAHDKPNKMYNFHLSGGYQQVMSARGSILRENPFKVSFSRVCSTPALDTKLRS